MAEPSRRVLVDKDLRPAYYDDFRCLAEGCKISCCKGWNITFGKKDYLSLKRQKGSPDLDARMAGGVRRIRKDAQDDLLYGEFNMSGGVCPLLREDGLCQLQMEKDHEALPFVCRTYPRTEKHMLSGYLERSMSPSCEGVLALLWDLPEGVAFLSDPLPRDQHMNVTPPADASMALWFPVVREWCMDLLQNRLFTLPQRIWLMGLGLKELADGETDIQRWVERAAVLPGSVDVSDVLPSGIQQLSLYLLSCIHTLFNIGGSDAVKGRIMQSLKLEAHLTEGATTIHYAPYLEARERYEENFKGREYFMENLMASVFFHLHMPNMRSREVLWKGYVNFCNLYAFFRFMAVMSCRKGAPGDREELFRHIVFASRSLLHNGPRQDLLRDEFFQHDSATLAHMAILLGG